MSKKCEMLDLSPDARREVERLPPEERERILEM